MDCIELIQNISRNVKIMHEIRCNPKLKFGFWCNPIWATAVALKVLPVSIKRLHSLPSPLKGDIDVYHKRLRSTYKGDDV